MRNQSGGERGGVHFIRPEAGDVEVTAYGLGGKEVDPDSAEALAKKAYDPATGTTRYWLKRATAGAEAGSLYNPHSPTFDRDGARRFHGEAGRGRYEFRRATAESFELYMRFLVSGNPVFIRNAERY